MKIFEVGEKLWDHTAKAIKILEGSPTASVPAVRPPDYDCEPGCDCPRSELEIGGRGHLIDCGRESKPRVHLDCNGKPLGYVPMPQLGRCVFDSEPHFLSDWCCGWCVMRADEVANAKR